MYVEQQSASVTCSLYRGVQGFGEGLCKRVRKKKRNIIGFHLPLMIQQLIIIISLELNHTKYTGVPFCLPLFKNTQEVQQQLKTHVDRSIKPSPGSTQPSLVNPTYTTEPGTVC